MKQFFRLYLLVMGFVMWFSAIIYLFLLPCLDDKWFSRLFISLVCFGFYVLSKDDE